MFVSVEHLNAWKNSHKVLAVVILGLARNDNSVLRCSQAKKNDSQTCRREILGEKKSMSSHRACSSLQSNH